MMLGVWHNLPEGAARSAPSDFSAFYNGNGNALLREVKCG
jgi:hypothetical protein